MKKHSGIGNMASGLGGETVPSSGGVEGKRRYGTRVAYHSGSGYICTKSADGSIPLNSRVIAKVTDPSEGGALVVIINDLLDKNAKLVEALQAIARGVEIPEGHATIVLRELGEEA